MRFAKFRSDRGSILLEFLGFGVLLQIPILLLCTTLIGVQHDQFVAEAITRNALRGFSINGTTVAQTVSEIALDYKMPISRVSVELSCRPSDCSDEGGWVELKTRIGSAIAVGVARK